MSTDPTGAWAGRPIRTFITLTGQRDNVGDSLLRRLFLDGLQQSGACAVYVGGGRAGYVANLGIRPQDRVYTELGPWLADLVRSVATTRTNLVMNTGEVTYDRRYSLRNLQTLPLALAVKARGGTFVHAGLGVRDVRSRLPAGSRLLAEIADVASWRDEPSRAMAGTGHVQPDWAFAAGTSLDDLTAGAGDEPDGAPVVVLSLRRDGWLPTKAWLRGMAEVCRAAGALPVVVCQVRRDATRCRSLASELGAEFLGWEPGVDHREQEQRLREVYRRSTWVVSNRLHVLVAAVTEGAVILPYVPDEHGKLARSLAAAGIAYEHVEPSAATAPRVADLPAARRELLAALGHARAELRDVVDRMQRALGGRQPGAIRVLHSMAAPTGDTRYCNQMAATASDSLDVAFFTWPTALLGRYDVFHLHWPEHLLHSGKGWKGRTSLALATVLAWRLRASNVAVVRTMHNLRPHERQTNAVRSVSDRLDRLAVLDINLVEERPADRRVPYLHIPHGGYREPFAEHDGVDPEPGRAVLFGMLKPYKGIDQLLAAFAGCDDTSFSLRFAGQPVNPEIAREIEQAVGGDHRISARLEFVSDADLVKEVTSASLVVLPYHHVYSSAVALAGLSLDRPLLLPDSATGRALADEVGEEWIRLYEPPLSPEVLAAAIRLGVPVGRPDLDARDWATVARSHQAAYAEALALAGRGALGRKIRSGR